MEPVHRSALQTYFGALVEQTDLELMVQLLYEKGVFSDRMIERYQDTQTNDRNRKRMLYRDVALRGPDAFRHLTDALQEAGYWDLAKDLDPDSDLHPQQFHSQFRLRHNQEISSEAKEENNFISISLQRKKNEVPEGASPPSPLEEGLDEQEGPDSIDDIPHFDVQKCTKFFEDNGQGIKLYRTRGPRKTRGVLLLFSYFKFQGNSDHYRNGVGVDRKKLKYLFDELGFQVICYENLNGKDTVSVLCEMNSVLKGVECVFIVVSSHGYPRAGSSDSEFRLFEGELMSVHKFLEYFNNENLPDLVGVPKVFIFQICRGLSEKELHRPSPWSSTTRYDGAPWADEPGAPPACPAPADTRGRLYSDMLIAHSTLPGFVSRRDIKLGSWYIQVLCEVFAKYAHQHHVQDLFALVDEQLAERFKVQTSSVDRWGFNRLLYLHPGLYEDQ